MNVLVTGDRGYIGSILVPMLKNLGHNICGIDSYYFERCMYGVSTDSYHSCKKDIREVELQDLDGIDSIIHLAGLSNDPLGEINPNNTLEINYTATVRLAELAKKAGIQKFIFSSTCSNYGAAGEDFVFEYSSLSPVTPYAVSKVKAEEALFRMADDTFSPVYLRNATAYGYSPSMRFDLVINNLSAWAFTSDKVFLKSDGNSWRPVVHVEDIARAFIYALQAPIDKVHNQVFNVGSTSENYIIRNLAEIVEKRFASSSVVLSKSASSDERSYRVNCDKIKQVLGFKTKWTVEKGVSQIYEQYKLLGLSKSEFESPVYKRVAHLKKLLIKGDLDRSFRWA